jgi:hypothetical protein
MAPPNVHFTGMRHCGFAQCGVLTVVPERVLVWRFHGVCHLRPLPHTLDIPGLKHAALKPAYTVVETHPLDPIRPNAASTRKFK